MIWLSLTVPAEEVPIRPFCIAFNSCISPGAFGETWNGKPIGGGVPGEIASFRLRGRPWDNTGLVYRNEGIAAIREKGPIGAATGARLDGRVAVG